MKKIILILILTASQYGISQELNETEKLTSLCKIWGFLKYYHPNVADGKFNWDNQLLETLPKVENAKNIEELSTVYLNWIESLGIVKESKSFKTENVINVFDKNFNLSWTQNSATFSNKLSNKLKLIENNRHQGKKYYVSATSRGNIEIKNELVYENFEFPEKDYRLLSLFRYWNTIEYFFPYKYQTSQNWDSVLVEMIPKFLNSKNAIEYQLGMFETVIKIDDTHANFYSNKVHEFFGKKYIPARFNLIENRAVISGFYNDSLAKVNDLRIGDILEKANNKNVLELIKETSKYVNGSNNNTKAKNYDFTIFNGSTDSIKLTITRNGTEITKNIGRYEGKLLRQKKDVSQEKYKIINSNIGYINMGFLEMDDVEKMMSIMKSTKAIIIDFRNYPKFQPYLIARRLIQKEKEFAKLIEPDLSYPGKFLWKKTKTITAIKNEYYTGKVIILVNEETQSAAEYSTMMLQIADNAITIGSQSAGADGDISLIEFIGFKSYMSGLGVFYPDGTETQRKGLKVDIEVRPTIEGIRIGKDEILEKAIEIAETKI
jgi:carboxyl-terminal processing protease